MVFFTVSTFLTFQPNLQVGRNQIEECKTTTFNFSYTVHQKLEREKQSFKVQHQSKSSMRHQAK